MAHALRYYKDLEQPNGTIVRLEIHRKKDGDAIMVSKEIGRVVQALHLDIQGGADTIDAPIVKTSLTMTFVDAPDLEPNMKCGDWEEFYTPDSTMWKVVLKADGKIIWSGYVTPDSYQEDLRYRGSVTIIARDNIGHMQDFPFDMEGNADGMVTLQELVNEAWAKIESPMTLDWRHEADDADYLLCDGVEAPQTYMNVSAFEDMNYFDAVEKALYSYGLVMRFVGSNRVTIMSLRDLPYQGKSGAPRAIEPTFLAHAQRELAPAVRRIEESVKYEDVEAVQPQVKPSDFSGVSDSYAYEFGHPNGATLETAPVHNIINTDERNGWANMPGNTLFFNAGLYELSNFDKIQPYADIMRRYMYIAVNNVQNISLDNVERFVSYGRNMLYQDFGFSLNLGILIQWSGALVLSKVTGYTLSGITYAVGCEYEGDIIYYAGDGKWQDSVCEITQEISGNEENNTIDIPVLVDRTKSYKTATFILYIRRISYTRQGDLASGRGLYAAVQSLSITHNNALLSDNTVNTVYNNDNNVIISRKPEIAPALNSVILPSVIKNGIFVKSGNAYLPAKGWAWSGGTPQQMAVYNHLQLLCYHSKPNNVISGDIVYADFVDMAAIYEWGGANHILVSGSYNFLNGHIESAVLREFKFYTEMWSDVAGTSLPETEQNNRTTAESGSGAAKSSTYSNATTVYIGGTGGGGSSTLAGLEDVNVTSVEDGQFLMFQDGVWIPQNVTGGGSIIVDSEMSDTSTNPVQNKVVKKYIDDRDVYLEGYAEGVANDAEAAAKQYTDEKISQIEVGGGISQENADKRYIRKVVDNFDSDLTFAIADGIVGTDDEYYFIPAKAPSTASDSQILATKEELNTKQGIINDLDTIRSGAAKGETAIQKVKTINGESIEGEGNIVIKGEEGGLKYVEERTVYPSKMIADGVEVGSYEISETQKAYNIETLDKAINERSVIIVAAGYIFQFVYSKSDSTERTGKFSYVGEFDKDLLSVSITINQDGDAIWEQKVLELGEGGETDTSKLATKEELNNLTNEVIANEEVHAAALNDLNERLNNISDSSSEDLVTFYLLGGGAVQDDTTKALNKQAYEAFWAYDEVPMVNILMVVGESNSKNDGFEALCPTAMAGAPNEDLLFIASPYRLTISPDGNVTLEAADIPGEVTIDDAMSDTSENAVQNKVIKQYVDEKVGNIDFSSLATKEEVQNLTDEIIANEEVHAAALNDLNERLNNVGGGSSGGNGVLRVWANELIGGTNTDAQIAENVATFNAITRGSFAAVSICAKDETHQSGVVYNTSIMEFSLDMVGMIHNSISVIEGTMEPTTIIVELSPDGSVAVQQ